MKTELTLAPIIEQIKTVAHENIKASFQTDEGIREYECVKEGAYRYIFLCKQDGRGLNGYHTSVEQLVINALMPVGIPVLEIKVFIDK